MLAESCWLTDQRSVSLGTAPEDESSLKWVLRQYTAQAILGLGGNDLNTFPGWIEVMLLSSCWQLHLLKM